MNTDFNLAEELKKLSRNELVALIRERGLFSVGESDIRRVRYDHLCQRAKAMSDAAMAEMDKHRGIENYPKYKVASRRFDRAMRLYDLAGKILDGGDR